MSNEKVYTKKLDKSLQESRGKKYNKELKAAIDRGKPVALYFKGTDGKHKPFGYIYPKLVGR